jgi:hypothetical protein
MLLVLILCEDMCGHSPNAIPAGLIAISWGHLIKGNTVPDPHSRNKKGVLNHTCWADGDLLWELEEQPPIDGLAARRQRVIAVEGRVACRQQAAGTTVHSMKWGGRTPNGAK